ncbi:SusC/RagA family TonB-linked outer membrane protein [Proteiniphilum sp. X52]|uniref:SusC/RagA family TonB-linked outer membrane protein n=1 Tax=Proteiniphilum sp. X52 TaxID=2382159 RepID=UPI000F09EDF1|nr:SusC/RagA family TonB-linked outer membrane protein [Proteiniphilum sp. X52]RNC63383.1 SusC/RagA family TonB-linked outer membrane protein [Proteiniphilum sp. X52]
MQKKYQEKLLRLTVILLLFSRCFIAAEAQTVSAPVKKTVKLTDVTIRELVDKLSVDFKYSFFIIDENVGKIRVSVNKRNATVTEILDEAFKGKEITYTVKNRNITIRNGNATQYPENSNNNRDGKVKTITGTVTDANTGESIIGANIVEKGLRSNGTVTDTDGKYVLKVAQDAIIEVSFIGYTTQEINTKGKTILNITLFEDTKTLEEVTVVGYGTQRKVSVIGSISNVSTRELNVGGVTSVSNALAGRIAGLVGIQRSGEPGQDVSEFWIRGISTFGANSGALILIDGMDRGSSSLNELAPEDIESFSILKDATATAVYGARGANGVVLINTKRGTEGKISINANVKTTLETLPRLPQYLGAYDYAKLANEAQIVRGGQFIYSPEIYDIIKYNMDPDLYPDVNWQKEILKKNTWGTQANINISGGGKSARYYMSGFYRTNEGIYKQTGLEKYNTNVRRNQYSFRSNIDVNATPTTRVSLLLSAKLIDMNRPGIGTTGAIWSAQANLTPLTVPLRYSNGQLPAYGNNHSLVSPSVLLNHTGFVTERENSIESLLVINQNLDFLVKGLNATGSVSFDNFNNHYTSRTKMPDLYYATDRNWNTGELMTIKTVVATPMTFGSSSYGIRTIYIESKLDYNQVIAERHRVGTMFLYNQKDYTRTDVSGEIASIPYRNQGIAGRLTYSYNDIYFIEGNFGYNGSENFPKGQRFGFFPSIALGYVVSNYSFIKEKAAFINTLKFRYSHGLVGNDKISNDVRFPYLTYIDMNASGYAFGDIPSGVGGVTESQLGSTGLVWEKAIKQNLGIDLQLWDAFNLTVDGFMDYRNNIFMQRVTLPGTIGVSVKPWGNVGKMKSWGADGTASYTKRWGDLYMEIRGNFTLTRDKIIDYDEVDVRYPYLAKKGSSNNITRGLIALGLFKDEEDVKNSPKQFGKVLPGDIKYKDINGDGIINSDDYVPIGNSNIPKIQYGFATSCNWKNLDFNIFFRGSSQVDYFMGGAGYYPFSGGITGNVLSIVNEQKNRWTPASYSGDPTTENPNARFPRLTYGHNENNNRNSTFWLSDASFLRLKTLEIGYTLPKKIIERLSMKNCRVSFIGDNLHVWDKVKLWDPEQASSNGAVYPLPRTFSMVLQISF